MSGSGSAASAGHPKDDELEITVLGGGFGESVVVHLGDREWLVVDSFMDGDLPAAERYLRSIHADLDGVRLVVATHWDNDHVEGMAALLRACPRATLGFPTALGEGEIGAYIRSKQHPLTANVGGPRAREIKAAFEEADKRPPGVEAYRPLLTGKPLFPRDPPRASVVALSPSSDDVIAAQAHMAESRRGFLAKVPKPSPNDLSVAMLVGLGRAHAVLGADLEANADGRRGWKAVIDFAPRPPALPDLLKVPHHGSDDAHEPRLWEEWLAPRPTSVVTGWHRAGRHRPTITDLERLNGLSRRVWISGYPPALVKQRVVADRQVVEEATGNVGRITARRRADGARWRIRAEGSAEAFDG